MGVSSTIGVTVTTKEPLTVLRVEQPLAESGGCSHSWQFLRYDGYSVGEVRLRWVGSDLVAQPRIPGYHRQLTNNNSCAGVRWWQIG